MKGLQNGDMAVKDAERQNIAAFGRGDCKGNDGGRHLPYNDFGSWLHSRFPYKVQKISVNAGFSCPNRDGRIGFGGCTFCDNNTFNPSYCDSRKSVAEQLEVGKGFFSRKYPDRR